jgi:hypothetical protein
MFKLSFAALLFSLALCTSSLANAQGAAPDPSKDQIYQAASHGRIREAEQMVEQVLRDHPSSATAHYVAAEVYAKGGDVSRARTELNAAERLNPGLSFAKPNAVAALKAELNSGVASHPVTREAAQSFSFPWGLLALIVVAVALIWAVMRRRREAQYRYATQVPSTAGGPQFGSPYGPTPGAGPMMGGGMGSGIAGGLASGLAVGAGVVAGEELARHFLDRDQHGAVVPPPEHQGQSQPNADPNADMGGDDFGLNSPDNSWNDDSSSSSWDDSSSFGDSGGGDWS